MTKLSFKIEKNVTLPPRGRATGQQEPSAYQDAFNAMEKGDSFFIKRKADATNKDIKALQNYLYTQSKEKCNTRISTRTNEKGMRVWKVGTFDELKPDKAKELKNASALSSPAIENANRIKELVKMGMHRAVGEESKVDVLAIGKYAMIPIEDVGSMTDIVYNHFKESMERKIKEELTETAVPIDNNHAKA